MKIRHLLLMVCVLLSLSLNAQEEIKPNSEGYFHIQIREDLYVISNMSWGGLAENGTPTQNSQLIVGKEKALLIDTGMPEEGFADYVKSITSLPLMVANSHGHFDHCGNNNQFDEIHIHPADEELLKEQFGMKFTVDYKVSHLSDGDIINLGDRLVEVYHVPGHTKGTVVFGNLKLYESQLPESSLIQLGEKVPPDYVTDFLGNLFG